ncbi:hypothetical protein RNZ42_08810 [Lacticaseibacillus paracasei]|uniref:hypothetical protein n=1 Tax=Lacticaseibacillus paracasei TaxID=1597 RepID=UPI001CDAB7EA|nr:hypothetical protein [Lacticaseibacillus paracasei]WNO50593.1 hypothetical protein RNZ42_08810 [Lacticaseibacillus paracasei]
MIPGVPKLIFGLPRSIRGASKLAVSINLALHQLDNNLKQLPYYANASDLRTNLNDLPTIVSKLPMDRDGLAQLNHRIDKWLKDLT